jgi:hypothetical protein
MHLMTANVNAVRAAADLTGGKTVEAEAAPGTVLADH